MKALILAAGRGSRMGALTRDQPKGLVQLGGRSLISRAVENLKLGGCRQVGIVTGYRCELVKPLADHTFHNPRWAETNMVASLAMAGEWLQNEPVIVSYSDIFYSSETVAALARCECPMAIAYDPEWRRLWEERFREPLSDAESFRLDQNAYLTEIGRKNVTYDDIDGQYMGLVKITPPAWSEISSILRNLASERRDKLDMTSLLSLLVGKKVPVQAVPCRGPWGECDCETDLHIYERWFDQGLRA